MGQSVEGDRIMLLLDNYSPESRMLHESFKQAGYVYPTICLQEDGFLPEDVRSVYSLFLGDYKGAKGSFGKPRHYNELQMPANWEVGGIARDGKIHYLQDVKGQLRYAEPEYMRRVKTVEWFDRRGTVRLCEHYNQYGAVYAKTVCDAKGKRTHKTWFSASGLEVFVENFVTGDMILYDDGKIRHFQRQMDFILYALKKAGFEGYRLFYNTLSTPYFVAGRFPNEERNNILFWQEPVGEEIPGNMQQILKHKSAHTSWIVVQREEAFQRLLVLGADKAMIRKLGFVYPYKKENRYRSEAFICTSSDHIEKCHEIVAALPEMHFHIAALTLMSEKLMNMEAYDNVSLYPQTWIKEMHELFEMCDFFFDIHHGREVDAAVYKAFLYNNLIVSFEETVHNRSFIAKEHIYPADDVERMIADVRAIMADKELMEAHLESQRKAALAETVEEYRRIVE